jgi:hypothetical protein
MIVQLVVVDCGGLGRLRVLQPSGRSPTVFLQCVFDCAADEFSLTLFEFLGGCLHCRLQRIGQWHVYAFHFVSSFRLGAAIVPNPHKNSTQ